MNKNTPGPWDCDLDYDGDGHHGINSRSEPWKAVADVTANKLGRGEVTREEAEANARLIAASPALLEICRCLLRSFEKEHLIHSIGVTGGEEQVKMLRAAIVKAEGRP